MRLGVSACVRGGARRKGRRGIRAAGALSCLPPRHAPNFTQTERRRGGGPGQTIENAAPHGSGQSTRRAYRLTRSNLNPFVSVSSSLRCMVARLQAAKLFAVELSIKGCGLSDKNLFGREIRTKTDFELSSKHASCNRCHALRRALRRDRESARTSTCMSYRRTVDVAALRWE